MADESAPAATETVAPAPTPTVAPADATPVAADTSVDPYDYGEPEQITLDPKTEPAGEQEKEPDAVEPTGSQPKTAPTAETIPADLVARAIDAGMTEQDLQAFESHKDLERTVGFFERKLSQLARQANAPRNEPPQAVAQPKQDAAPAPEIPDLDEKVFDPAIVDAFKSVKSTLAGFQAQAQAAIEGARAEARAAVDFMRGQQQAAFEKRFDSQIAQLGEDYHALLGKGAVHELKVDGEHMQNRLKVLGEMDALAAGYKMNGRPVPAEDVLFRRALNSAFGERHEALVRAKLGSTLKKRSGQIIGKPVSRVQEKSDRGSNVKAAYERLREQGKLEPEVQSAYM